VTDKLFLASCTRRQLENLLRLALAADHTQTVTLVMHELLERDMHDYETPGYSAQESVTAINDVMEDNDGS